MDGVGGGRETRSRGDGLRSRLASFDLRGDDVLNECPGSRGS